jgi:hypothetical protein
MQARFNFFLVAFGLWVVGIASIPEKIPKRVFLGFGIVICLLLWLAIRRICQKVIAALKLILADTAHPARQVHLAAGKSRVIPIRSNHLIGYVIPLSCIFVLFVWGGYIAIWQ